MRSEPNYFSLFKGILINNIYIYVLINNEYILLYITSKMNKLILSVWNGTVVSRVLSLNLFVKKIDHICSTDAFCHSRVSCDMLSCHNLHNSRHNIRKYEACTWRLYLIYAFRDVASYLKQKPKILLISLMYKTFICAQWKIL